MKPQLKSMGLSLTVLAILATGTIGCSKNDSNSSEEAQKAVVRGREVETGPALQNSTTSEVVKVAAKHYAVLPPASEMNGVSYSNEPIKSACKNISRLKSEIARLEDEKARYVEIAEVDYSAEQGVDELASDIEMKQNVLTELSSKTGIAYASYDKQELFANMASLKAANPELTFEIADPKSALVTLEGPNRKTSSSSSVDLSKAKMKGSFASQDTVVKMNLPLSYEIICAYKDLKSAKDDSQKMFLSLK